MSSALGFMIAGYVSDPTRIGTIAPWTEALLTTLPPVYYPLEIIPPQYFAIVLVAPTTHLAQMARVVTKVSSSAFNPSLHSLAIFAYIIAFMLLASFKSRWREK